MKPQSLIPGTPDWDKTVEVLERMCETSQRAYEAITPEECEALDRDFAKREAELKLVAKAKYEKAKERIRERIYAVSPDQFAVMLKSQDGRCAACRAPFGMTRELVPCVDHNHATDHVRGLLCGMCNLTLGHAHDNPEILRGLIRYLESRP